jgi:hypothetical protein
VETAAAFCDTLRQYSAPCPIWTDNGKEFEDTFQSILKERDIRHVYSASLQPKAKREIRVFLENYRNGADGRGYH